MCSDRNSYCSYYCDEILSKVLVNLGKLLSGNCRVVNWLDDISSRVLDVETARSVCMIMRLVNHWHIYGFEIVVPGIYGFFALHDESIVIKDAAVVRFRVGTRQRQIVISTGEINKVVVCAIEKLHTHYIGIKLLALFQIIYPKGNVANTAKIGWACLHLYAPSLFRQV